MSFSLILSIVALIVALGSVTYSLRVKKRQTGKLLTMPPAERMCYAWNNHYMVGILVAFEPQPFDPVAGRLAGRTTSKAYVRNGEAVVDLERHGTINLIMNEVFPI